MLAEFARVLKPAGLLVISSPNKRVYSDERDYVNEFHRHELYRDGLSALLAPAFPAQRWFHQRVAPWSAIWGEGSGEGIEAWLGDAGKVSPYAPADGMYFVVVAAREAGALPAAAIHGSLFTDAEETEQKRARAQCERSAAAGRAAEGPRRWRWTGRPRTSITSRRWSPSASESSPARTASLPS